MMQGPAWQELLNVAVNLCHLHKLLRVWQTFGLTIMSVSTDSANHRFKPSAARSSGVRVDTYAKIGIKRQLHSRLV